MKLARVALVCICGADHGHVYWADDGPTVRCCGCGQASPAGR